MLQCERYGDAIMVEYFEEIRGATFAERYLGGWRVIASAWAIALAIIVLFAGVEAMASRHVTPVPGAALAGVVIPRHDPSCGGSGDLTAASTPNCSAATDAAARAEIEAQSEATFDW
jgi:hypothetical protein